MSEDKEIEKDILLNRKYDFNSALSQAGGRMLDKESTVPRLRQVKAELDQYIKKNVSDLSGSLVAVLSEIIHAEDHLIASDFDRPLQVLRQIVERILKSDENLSDFVRRVDMKYGQMYLERPHFQQPGDEAHPDDEYTLAGVKQKLNSLLESLQK